MIARRWWSALAALVWLGLGGCPLDPMGTLTLDAASRSTPTQSANSSRDPSSAAGPTPLTEFEDRLQRTFPDCRDDSRADQWRDEILALVNQERTRIGLAPVRRSPVLEKQATQYACELIHFDFFDHVNPVTGSTLIDRAGEFKYDFLVIGENIGAGQKTPQQVFNDWMESPGHRKNILDERFVELGVGARRGGRFGFYWVQEFGRPAP